MGQQKLYFKKFYKNKGNWIPILVFIVAILLVLIMNTRVADERNMAGMVQAEISMNEEMLALNGQRNESAETAEEKAAFKEGEELSRARINTQKRMVELYNNEKWAEAYRINIHLTKESFGLYDGETPASPELRESISRDIAIYTKLAELDIKSDQVDMETQGATFLYRTLANFFPVLFVIILCFTLNAVFTDRFYGHLDRSLLLPQKYIVGTVQRLLFGLLLAVVLYIVTCLIAYLSASAFSGSGSFAYPIAIDTRTGVKTESVGSLLVQTVALQLLAIIVVVLMIDLVSKLCKRMMSTLFISLLVVVAPVLVVGKIVPLDRWAHLLPGTYFNAVSVVDNSLAIISDNGSISFINGVIVLIVMTTILLILNFGMDGWRSKGVTLNIAKQA
ncbi:hypothetical protein [Listeria newyorkensis]|uniref:Uncharacterized protein n=1 Tax=Listeria newyorkensis TaxID=1497681 RepID=A0A841Z119_9LIST|nr:hypothetical protein [Listeria newyorkensis]MBC1458517.1 hypothetical protein [Listeria newyorkensis]